MAVAAIAFIIVLSAVVMAHELGHYIAARRAGIRVESVSLGFGKVLLRRRDRNGTEWRVSLIPLGGYAGLYGQSDVPEDPEKKAAFMAKLSPRKRAEHFESKTRGQKAMAIFAGPLANYILALVVFFGLFLFAGVREPRAKIINVEPGTPAYVAGLKPGDEVVSIAGRALSRGADIAGIVNAAPPAAPIEIGFRRGEAESSLAITPQYDAEAGRYRLGFSYGAAAGRRPVGFFEAAQAAGGEVWRISAGTARALGEMIIGRRSAGELGGFITIAKASGNALEGGLYQFFYIIAFLSVSLGLFNLFPIPMLDGGYLFIYLLEALRGRDFSARVKARMFNAGFAAVILVMALANFNDIARLFK